MLNLTVDLSEGLFAAHGEDGVSETDKQKNPSQVREESPVEPAQRILVERNRPLRAKRTGWQLDGSAEHCDGAPADEDHNHHGRDNHDLQGFLTGLVDALRVLPPEIDHDNDGEPGGEVDRKSVV